MSANDHTSAHEEVHTGPIKTPKQLLAAVFFSFVIPIFGIIGLVYYVTSANKTAPGAVNTEKAIAERIRKVGSVEIRDANRPLKAGEEVYKAQCVACHGIGAAGSPKFGDVAAWAPRIKTGFEALWNSALKGKNAMPAQGGGDFNDVEVGRAVVYMTAAAGGKFAEPAVPAANASAPAAGASVAAVGPSPEVVAALAVANKGAAAPAVTATAGGAVPALYTQACAVCHAAGIAGAPKFGDKTTWGPRIGVGVDALTASAIKGKNAMPPRGGATTASDVDIKAVVQYMVNAVK